MNETELLFSEVLDCDRASLYLDKGLIFDKYKSRFISTVLKRRLRGEPLQYILGKAGFMGLEFKVNKDVLIPRQETEILVEAAIKYAPGKSVLELGTGSGCIAVSLAKFLPTVKIYAADISLSALEVARENAALNDVAGRIEFIQGGQQPTVTFGPSLGSQDNEEASRSTLSH